MPKVIDIQEILRKNPQISPQDLQASMELMEKLKGAGVHGRRYELAPPFAGKRVQVVDSSTEDPRTIHLKSRT